jgi:hypothetical protein
MTRVTSRQIQAALDTLAGLTAEDHKQLDGRTRDEIAHIRQVLHEILEPSRRKILTPNRDSGWAPRHTVEVELVDRHPPIHHSTYAVYLNGQHVGHVCGYARHGRQRASWGHQPGPGRPILDGTRYFHDSRLRAIEALIEHALRTLNTNPAEIEES